MKSNRIKKIKPILFFIITMLFINLIKAQTGIYSIETGNTISKIRVAKNSTGNYLIASSYEGKILAINYDKTILWTNDLSGFTNHDVWCEDITGDGIDEIIAANADGKIYCLDNQGNLLWAFSENEAPMMSVCVITKAGTPYVVCGGFDMNIYYLDAAGKKIKTIASSTYSKESTFGNNAPPSGIHIANFIRKIKKSNGEEDLVVHGAINTNSTNGSLYFFNALANQPYATADPKNEKPVGDVRVSDLFGNGKEKILLGSSTIHNTMDLSVYSHDTKEVDDLELSNKKNQLGGFGYRVIQSEIIPKGNDSYEYFTLIGHNVALIPPSQSLADMQIVSGTYAYNDMWRDKENDLIILASSQSGGSAVHVINYKSPNWKNDFRNLKPIGNIQAILDNTKSVRDQLASFTRPIYERAPKPVYFVSDLSTSGSPSSVSNLVEDIRNNYDSPILMGSIHMPRVQDPTDWNRDTMSNTFYRNTRDQRKTYTLTQEEVLDRILPGYANSPGVATWGGHGNDPYMYSIDTKKAILDGANGKKTVFIYPELEKSNDDFVFVVKNLMYPLATYARPRNGQIHIRTKHIFWQGAAHRSIWSRMNSGEFADIFVPTMEETGDKSQDLTIAGRMGFWLSGAVDQWGTRAVPDNSSYGRLRQFSTQRLPNHHFRQVLYALASGATHLNNLIVDIDYTSLAWELVAKGALYVPNKNEILSISPVHLSMSPNPDPYYLNEGTNTKWLTFFDEQKEADNKLVFSRLNGTWMGSPVTEWDFSSYAASETERRLNYIPAYNNGMVLITPVQHGALAQNNVPRGKLTDHLHPFYKDIMKEYITDGRNYISNDGTQNFAAETYYQNVKTDIENAASLLPITVTGDVGWVVAQTDSLHLRLTIIDGGYINPSKKNVQVNFQSVQPFGMTDVLDGEVFNVANTNSINVEIPCGMFRFFDIELSKPFGQLTTNTKELPTDNLALTVYPNPASDHITVKFYTKQQTANLEILDNTGKVIRQWKVGALTNELSIVTLDLAYLPAGSYFLRILETGQTKIFVVP